MFTKERPDDVVLAAARVGGIRANAAAPGEFIAENLQLQTAVIEAARRAGVRRLLFFGSTCAYPKHCRQPMREEDLWTGPLEPTSLPYAVAKLAGLTMCQAYARQYGLQALTLIPSTLYGPGDDFNPDTSHVVSGLMRRMHEAKAAGAPAVALWGAGTARREFLYADDLADACRWLLELDDASWSRMAAASGLVMNVGAGEDLTLLELAEQLREVVGYRGRIDVDPSHPDGAPRKLLDSTRIRGQGWAPSVPLADGLRRTYAWYVERQDEALAHVR
jgi:GDP-L-fucose synthase